MVPYLLIGVGGVLGANARYLVSTWAASRFGTAFPTGTLIVNVTGSFLIGLVLQTVLVRFDNDADARLLVATGFLGAYTTFSTFAFETVALLRQRDLRAALTNSLGSAGFGIGGAAAGILLANLMTGQLG